MDRCTVQESLLFPFMEELHCEEDEPVATPIDRDGTH
jgi:hypothetical protein